MKTSNKNRAVLAETIAKAIRDPQFRAELKKEPKKILEAAGAEIAATTEVEVLENTDKVIFGVLPPDADQHKYQAKIDEETKKLSKLPAHVELRIVRDTPNKAYIVIPAATPRITPGRAGGPPGAQLDVSFAEAEVAVGAVAAAEAAAVVVAVVVPCFIS